MSQRVATWAKFCLVTLVLNGAASTARAQSINEKPVEETQTEPLVGRSTKAPQGIDSGRSGVSKEWYGAPIVGADSAAVLLTLIGAGIGENSPRLGQGLLFSAVGLYALGGPIVHFSEDRIGTGFESLGLRAGTSLVGGVIGWGIGASAYSGCSGESCGIGKLGVAAMGVGAGMIAASIIDSSVLAYRPPTRAALFLSVTPTYHPTTGEKGLALSGTW